MYQPLYINFDIFCTKGKSPKDKFLEYTELEEDSFGKEFKSRIKNMKNVVKKESGDSPNIFRMWYHVPSQ